LIEIVLNRNLFIDHDKPKKPNNLLGKGVTKLFGSYFDTTNFLNIQCCCFYGTWSFTEAN
jgi:hypothetical protein